MHLTAGRLVASSAAALLLLGLPAGSALAAETQLDPRGNNGTVKIEDRVIDRIPENDPHQPCVFRVEWFGFDLGATSRVTFALHDPTDEGELSVAGPAVVNVGADRARGTKDKDGSQLYTLSFTGAAHPKQGHHVRLDIETNWSQGSQRKSKVFWVGPCQGDAPAPSPTPPSDQPTPSQEPSPSSSQSSSPQPSPGGGGGSTTPTPVPSEPTAPGTPTEPASSEEPTPTTAPSPGDGGGSGLPSPSPSDAAGAPESGSPDSGAGAGSGHGSEPPNSAGNPHPARNGVPTSVSAGVAMVTKTYDSPTSPASLLTALVALLTGAGIVVVRRLRGRHTV